MKIPWWTIAAGILALIALGRLVDAGSGGNVPGVHVEDASGSGRPDLKSTVNSDDPKIKDWLRNEPNDLGIFTTPFNFLFGGSS